MPELGSSGSVRGALSNKRPYRELSSHPDRRAPTAHRAKLAHVYVRQSSPEQVRHHQESTELQYRLVERATVFGWPRERVHVVDDDLGKSGTSCKDRLGFRR
jgi:hypothetical protein